MGQMDRFKEKVVVVTGAGTGIGLSICRFLLEEGAKVVLNDRDNKTLENLDFSSENFQTFIGDVAKVAVIEELIAFSVEKFGTIDHVVANAGLTIFQPFLEFTEENFDAIHELNVKGTFFLCQAFSKELIRQNKRGNIALVSSNIGMMAFPNLSAYSISKAAIRQIARNLVAELSPYGIRINALAPGATLTKRTEQEEENYWDTWSKITPLNQIATETDVAEAVLFLLSDQAKHITGQTLVIDGGWEANGYRPNGVGLHLENKYSS